MDQTDRGRRTIAWIARNQFAGARALNFDTNWLRRQTRQVMLELHLCHPGLHLVDGGLIQAVSHQLLWG